MNRKGSLFLLPLIAATMGLLVWLGPEIPFTRLDDPHVWGVLGYLLTLALPPEGQVCAANTNPFLPRLARTARQAPLLVGLPPDWMAR